MKAIEYGDIRVKAAEALGEIGDSRAVEPLINVLRNSDVFVRRWTPAAAFGMVSESGVKDMIAVVRISVAQALGNIGDEKAIEPLKQLLNDEDEKVREAVRNALDQIQKRKKN